MKNGGPAFPRPISQRKDSGGFEYERDGHAGAQDGMTLRDYFAAKAMQSLISDSTGKIRDASDWIRTITGAAYEIADAMLKMREES